MVGSVKSSATELGSQFLEYSGSLLYLNRDYFLFQLPLILFLKFTPFPILGFFGYA